MLACIILSLAADHQQLTGQVVILLLVRMDLESYWALAGTCRSFCSSNNHHEMPESVCQIAIASYT